MPAFMCLGPVKDKIPPAWTSIDIIDLDTETDITNRYVLLEVFNRFKHHNCQVNRLKMVLVDCEGYLIELYAFGQTADDLDVCKKGDVLLCLNFVVDICPSDAEFPYQILADDRRQEKSLIWVSIAEGNAVTSKLKPDQVCNKKSKGRTYTYKALSEILVNTIVDVFAVVKYFKPAVRGRGSDYCCVIGLVDPSLDEQEDKLTCVVFNREPDKLPKVKEGDIVRFHRLKIQTYQGTKQGYNGPGFQWVAFHGSLGCRTYSSDSYTFEDQDKVKVTGLLDWWSTREEPEQPTTSTTTYVKKQTVSLEDVRPKTYFNIVCQVVQVCMLKPKECRLLKVWDGTRYCGPLKTVTEDELNSSVMADDALIQVAKNQSVDIFIFDDHALNTDHIKPGDFILLTNVHSSVVSGQVELTVHGGGARYDRGCQVLTHTCTKVEMLKQRLHPLCTPSPNRQVGLKNVPSNKNILRQSSGESTGCLESIDQDNTGNASRGFGRQSVGNCSNEQRMGDTQPFEVTADMSSFSHRDMQGAEEVSETQPFLMSDGVGGSQRAVRTAESLNKQRVGDTQQFSLQCGEEKDDSGSNSDDASQSIYLSVYDDAECASQKKPHGNAAAGRAELGGPIRVERNRPVHDHIGSIMSIIDDDDDDDRLSHCSFVTAPSPEKCGLLNLQALCERNQGLKRKNTQSSSLDEKNIHMTCKKGNDRSNSSKSKHFLIKSSKSFHQMEQASFSDASDDSFDKATSHTLEQSKSKDSCDSSQNSEQRLDSLCSHLPISPDLWSQPQSLQANGGNAQNMTTGSGVNNVRATYQHEDACEHPDRDRLQQHLDIHSNNLIQDADTQPPSEPENQEAVTGDSQVSSSTDSVSSQSQTRCMMRTASVVENPHIKISSLSQVCDSPSPAMLRVQAHVEKVERMPATAFDIVHFLCTKCKLFTRLPEKSNLGAASSFSDEFACPECSKWKGSDGGGAPSLRPLTLFVIHLSDGPHTIPATVWGKNADKFLNGITPHQLLHTKEDFLQVQKWLSDLVPTETELIDRPVLECCIAKYTAEGHVKYQVCDTTLV